MTAPTPAAALIQPDGIKNKNGFKTCFHFSYDPDIPVWGKTGQPPGYEGGDSVDQTTFLNTTFRTKAPRTLIDVTNPKIKVAYDAKVYPLMQAMINREQTITAFWLNGDRLAFYGYVKSFIPTEHTEGNQPEADLELVVTNVDPATGEEEEPVFTAASGT